VSKTVGPPTRQRRPAQLTKAPRVPILNRERVSWERTPPPLLERVIEAEAVHSISSWEEVGDRRCFPDPPFSCPRPMSTGISST
jgi:hypothetical protein